jgi:hypothetical protein
MKFVRYKKFEIRRNFSTPKGSDTRYWCTINKRVSTKKSHIVAVRYTELWILFLTMSESVSDIFHAVYVCIQFKPILETPDALAHTHHYQITVCKPPPGGPTAEEIYEPWINFEGEECYQNAPTIPKQYCNTNMYAWSNGGEVRCCP